MKLQKFYAVIIFASSIVLSIVFFVYRDFFRGALSLGLLGLFIINFVSSAGFFVSGPAFLTVIAGGSLYSPILVALVAAVGACLGDMLGFAFGYSGRQLAKKKISRQRILVFLQKKFNKHGELIIFMFAVVPNPFFDAVGILAGIVNYPPLRFFVIMLFGRFLRYWLLAQVGSRL
jgi:membrane protein YqaA with SNARE-associated domain